MGAHRYWRIQAKTVQAGTNFGLGEIEMRATPAGADQCAGGTAAASSTFAGLTAAGAFDNGSLEWATLTNQHIDGWIRYDFGVGASVTVLEVSILPRAAAPTQGPATFYVSGSDDAVTWIDYKYFTAAGWVAATPQVFTVPAASALGALRVGAVDLAVMHNNKGALRAGAVNVMVLRSITNAAFTARRRQQQVT